MEEYSIINTIEDYLHIIKEYDKTNMTILKNSKIKELKEALEEYLKN